jgi:hypothetical protein
MLIQNTAAHVYIIDEVTFMPGVNNVTTAMWAKIKNHPHVKPRLNDGLLEIISEAETEDGFTSLSGYKLGEAKKLVEGTFEVSLLKTWKAEEKRKDVKGYIVAQLKKIEGEAFKDSDAKHFKN